LLLIPMPLLSEVRGEREVHSRGTLVRDIAATVYGSVTA